MLGNVFRGVAADPKSFRPGTSRAGDARPDNVPHGRCRAGPGGTGGDVRMDDPSSTALRSRATFPGSRTNRMHRSGPPRRVPIVDVARHANVSTTAVSKVLRNAYGASPAMQEKVRQAI